MPTDRKRRHHEVEQVQHNNTSTMNTQKKSNTADSSTTSLEKRSLFRYAKRFAVLTIITAYLGKHASPEQAVVASFNVGGFMSLYGYILPGITNDSGHWALVYFVLLCVALNKFIQAMQSKMKKLQRSITDQALQSVKSVSQIRPTASIGRFLSSTNASKNNLNLCSGHDHDHERQLIISASNTFVSTAIMDEMTLADMAHIFLYASKLNQHGFDRSRFLTECRPPTQKALDAFDNAMACSRGPKVAIFVPAPRKQEDGATASTSDSMDALAFCAVARIFAEWRNLRAVPPGCPGFAFGLGLARRDLVQNIRKIEQAAHAWLDFHEGVLTASTSTSADSNENNIRLNTSPSLRQLLQHEIEMNAHHKLPRLTEKSAASGLLWTKRQLQYQSSAMENNAKVPLHFPSPKAAFNAAYESVYEKYHGFLVRTIFQNTFEAAPPASEVLQYMNMPYMKNIAIGSPAILDDVNEKESGIQHKDDYETWVQLPLEDWEDEMNCLQEETNAAESSVQSPIVSYSHSAEPTEGREPENFDLGDKIVQIFSSVFGHCVAGGGQEAHESRNALSSIIQPVSNTKKISTTENETAAERNDVPFYLSVLRPLEKGLDGLIDDLNMNDPSRV